MQYECIRFIIAGRVWLDFIFIDIFYRSANKRTKQNENDDNDTPENIWSTNPRIRWSIFITSMSRFSLIYNSSQRISLDFTVKLKKAEQRAIQRMKSKQLTPWPHGNVSRDQIELKPNDDMQCTHHINAFLRRLSIRPDQKIKIRRTKYLFKMQCIALSRHQQTHYVFISIHSFWYLRRPKWLISSVDLESQFYQIA